MSTAFEALNGSQPCPSFSGSFPSQLRSENFVNNLQQFATTLNGNPEQMVKNLIQNGLMSQQEFQRYGQQASQIQQSLRSFLH